MGKGGRENEKKEKGGRKKNPMPEEREREIGGGQDRAGQGGSEVMNDSERQVLVSQGRSVDFWVCVCVCVHARVCFRRLIIIHYRK
jgi:hypothetical protein